MTMFYFETDSQDSGFIEADSLADARAIFAAEHPDVSPDCAGVWGPDDNEYPAQSHDIEVACDTEEVEQFVAWLNSQGHVAKVGDSTGNFVDGARTSESEAANAVMRNLWDSYCNQ